MRRGAALRVIVIALLVAAIVTAVAIFIPWLPDQASSEADEIDFVFWFVTAICVGVFAVVAGISIYAGIKFRARPDDDSDGPPVHGHTGLEILWTAIPAVLVTAIAIVSTIALARNDSLPDEHLRVHVIAQQFTWRFEYPDHGELRSATLRLPVGRAAHLTMEARDVIHSFYVPEFRQKRDVVPGEVTNLIITPTKTGDYTIQCAELCGLGHAAMLQKVEVVEQTAFDEWAEGRAEEMEEGGEVSGQAIFAEQGCGGCHTFGPAGSTAEQGPPLDNLPELADRAGEPLDQFIRESIVNPDAYVERGYPNVMPPFDLPDEQLDALVEFLSGGAAEGGDGEL
ncbi:MAG: cytochrome c oxidase subunit II [Thermoleophilia bacterium]|nr:cytochrome c oxidase subunit II [Thermoleophilia bacterium]